MAEGACSTNTALARRCSDVAAQDHPFGFSARPRIREDGSTNMLLWECSVPGKAGTAWEGTDYALTLGAHAVRHAVPGRASAS